LIINIKWFKKGGFHLPLIYLRVVPQAQFGPQRQMSHEHLGLLWFVVFVVAFMIFVLFVID
jgi:hypothetical protein